MPFRNMHEHLTRLTAGIDESETLEDLGRVIDVFSDAAPYQIVHFGVCKIDNTVTKDIVFTRNVKGQTVGPNSFSDEIKVHTVNEALSLMRPYDMMTHDFTTCETANFEPLRAAAKALGISGIIIIPYRHQNTISAVILICRYEFFQEHINSILPSIFLLISKTFARFPSLAKWPEEYRLTDREAQILHISSQGARESDIAADLGLSVSTIRNHVENAKRKLEARNKAHAIAIAMQSGEIDPLSHRRSKS